METATLRADVWPLVREPPENTWWGGCLGLKVLRPCGCRGPDVTEGTRDPGPSRAVQRPLLTSFSRSGRFHPLCSGPRSELPFPRAKAHKRFTDFTPIFP